MILTAIMISGAGQQHNMRSTAEGLLVSPCLAHASGTLVSLAQQTTYLRKLLSELALGCCDRHFSSALLIHYTLLGIRPLIATEVLLIATQCQTQHQILRFRMFWNSHR
jgi:hypothetical protein